MIERRYTLLEFSQRLESLGLITLSPALGRKVAVIMQADVKEQFYGSHDEQGNPWVPLKFPRPAGGNKPLLSTGILANSYHAYPDPHGVTVASTHQGAALHQNGGVVRPVKAKALAIPLTKEAGRVSSPRNFPEPLFLVRPKRKKHAYLIGRQVKKTRGKKKPPLTFHYILVAKATIPARPVGLSDDAIQAAAEVILDDYTRAI